MQVSDDDLLEPDKAQDLSARGFASVFALASLTRALYRRSPAPLAHLPSLAGGFGGSSQSS